VDNISFAPVPEPRPVTLLLVGAAVLSGLLCQRAKRRG